MARGSRKRNTVEDFWSRVVPGPNGCWDWTSTVTHNGYGTISWNCKTTPAHRLAYELTKGPIPDGLFACHTCDRRCCVNPDHIFLGTVLDNARDMVMKGRAATGAKNGRHTQPERTSRGEGRPAAKLTWGTVREIRARRGTESYRDLGRRFGISNTVISNIMNNRAWRESN